MDARTRFVPVGLFAAALLALSAPIAAAQSVDWNKISPAEKLMARRAARLDALRELGELVKSLPIGNGRTLGDIDPDTSVFLTGATEVGAARYLASGYVKVTMRMPASAVLEHAATLARKRGIGLDMTALRGAVGASLEATGLGRPRSVARRLPAGEKRQGRLEQPKKRFADRSSAEPRQSEERMRRLLDKGERFGKADKDRDRKQWDREWKRESDEWERRWRRDAEQWRRQRNAWEQQQARAAKWRHRIELMSIDKQWEMGKPIGNGWRLLPDGSRIRLLSDRTYPGRVIRRGTSTTPRWGEEVISETVTEQVIEQRVIVR